VFQTFLSPQFERNYAEQLNLRAGLPTYRVVGPQCRWAMGHQFEVFEIFLKKRGRAWTWGVISAKGKLIMQGSEYSRLAASYIANRALFLLLLSSPYRSKRRDIPDGPERYISESRSDGGTFRAFVSTAEPSSTR
jgi:hypothetical protein